MSGRFTVRASNSHAKKAHRLVVRAWVSLVFYPLSFVTAFVVGEGLLSWYGYSDTQPTPFWIAIAAAGPALVVFSVPGILAVRFGRQAVRQGNPDGQTPATVGAVIAIAMVSLNVLSGIAQAVFG